MDIQLTVIGGRASQATVTLRLPAIIGRSHRVSLTIGHPMVSRQHCRLYEANGVLMVCDLGSLNGTRVQGQWVREAPLRPNDELTVGPLTFRTQYDYRGDAKDLPPVKPADAPAQRLGDAEEGPDSRWAYVPVGFQPAPPSVDIDDHAREHAIEGETATPRAPQSPWADSVFEFEPPLPPRNQAVTGPASDSAAEPEPDPPPNLRRPEDTRGERGPL